MIAALSALLACGCAGGGSARPPSVVVLTVQQRPNNAAHWKTDGTAKATCGSAPTVTGGASIDASALCSAIDYYVRHPGKLCSFGPPSQGPVGELIYREQIKGRVAGHRTNIWINSYLMCNVTGRLASAMKLIGNAVSQ